MREAAFGLVLTWGLLPGLAWASFSAPASPVSMAVGTATLAAPTSPAAQNVNCQALTSTRVRVTWTATSSAFADGYEVLRSGTNGGPYSAVGTVSGQSTTTYTDTTVQFSQTYYYVVRATKLAWRSGNSSQVTITTPSSLCV